MCKLNPQDNVLVEWSHQLIYNMLVTKDIDNKVFNYIYPWCENLASKAWEMRDMCDLQNDAHNGFLGGKNYAPNDHKK